MLQTSAFRIIPKPLSKVLSRLLHSSTWEPFNETVFLLFHTTFCTCPSNFNLVWVKSLSAHSSQRAVPLSAYKRRNLYPVNYTCLCLDQMLVVFCHVVPSSLSMPLDLQMSFPKGSPPCVKPWDYPTGGYLVSSYTNKGFNSSTGGINRGIIYCFLFNGWIKRCSQKMSCSMSSPAVSLGLDPQPHFEG